MQNTNADIVRRFTEHAWGLGKLDVVDELVHPDAPPPHGATVGGPAGYREEIMGVRNGLSEYRTVVEACFGMGDLVAIRWSSEGRHTGSLFGFPPSGKPVHIVGVGMFQLVGGKIFQHWGEDAMPALLGQIGAFPGHK
jgi:predicted ester cyclase